ncbi:hypothetical protein ABFA07_014389 [Porites harrisoni]
MSFISV